MSAATNVLFYIFYFRLVVTIVTDTQTDIQTHRETNNDHRLLHGHIVSRKEVKHCVE